MAYDNSSKFLIDWLTAQKLFNEFGFTTTDQEMQGMAGGPAAVSESDPRKFSTDKVDTSSFKNYKVYVGETAYTVKNAVDNQNKYNLYDVIALAKSAGKSNEDILRALVNTQVSNGHDYRWTNDDVVSAIQKVTPAASKIQAYLNKNYSEAGATVDVRLNTNGTSYTYYVNYTDPYTGNTIPVKLENVTGTDVDDNTITDLLNAGSTTGAALNNVHTYNKTTSTNIQNNANASITLADKVEQALSGSVGTGVNAHHNLSQKDNPQLLKRLDLDTLQGIADTVSEEQQSITERGIKNQRINLLQAIAKDPTLYEQLTNQIRSDNAAGTLAGQRAANAQRVAAEADANYDDQAADLYASLFGGEKGNVAQQDYSTTVGLKTNALNQYIQGQIDKAIEAQRQGAITAQEYSTILRGLEAALDVEGSAYADKIKENQAIADKNATDLSTDLQAELKKAIALNDRDLDKIQNIFNNASKWLDQGSNGSADVSNAVNAFINALPDEAAAEILSKASAGGYTTVDAGGYEAPEALNNKHYNDLVNSDFIKELLSSDTVNALTKAQTLEEFKKTNGLDMLSLEGLTTLYDQYNTEATRDSNRIFNKAQRAYIAAITAGDAKTAEQLTRLATSAGSSKGNLYAASALANQFKQQSGLNTSGRQLATDYLNQQSFNRTNAANIQAQADAALGTFLGTGADSFDRGTLYSAFNQSKQNAASIKDAYGSLANKHMTTTQGLNSGRIGSAVDDLIRKTNLASEYTLGNVAGAVNNITNQGTKDSLLAATEALRKQAETNLKK